VFIAFSVLNINSNRASSRVTRYDGNDPVIGGTSIAHVLLIFPVEYTLLHVKWAFKMNNNPNNNNNNSNSRDNKDHGRQLRGIKAWIKAEVKGVSPSSKLRLDTKY
jgi:hypothetical protein